MTDAEQALANYRKYSKFVDEALQKLRDTRAMLEGRKDGSYHIPNDSALYIVFETLDKAEEALSAIKKAEGQ